MQFPLPPSVVQRVLAWDGGEPTVARHAATVVLLRDGARGPEAFLLIRSSGMAAFGGMTVFPGGSVDPGDLGAAPRWYGPEPSEWPLNADDDLARALVCAAVRETFEESGVLFAGSGDTVAAVDGPEWEARRRALEKHEVSLSALLAEHDLGLRADLLRPWAHWITPVQEKYRFDVRFFAAGLPAGQQAREVIGEAERTAWMRPADALAARASGELVMVPPTAVTLSEMSTYSTVAGILAADRDVRPITPELIVTGPSTVEFRLP